MKYSARLVTALAAVALLVAVLVALGNSTRNAYAASDGKVYLTNKWSKLTTEPSPATATGRKAVSGTLYSTFVERTSAGVAESTIATDSAVVIITVIDPDADIKVTATTTHTWTSATTTGTSFPIALEQSKSPIVDNNGDGLVDTNDVTITNVVGTATVGVSNIAPGTDTTPGIATVAVLTSGTLTSFQLNWATSSQNEVTVTVKSTNQVGSISVTLKEVTASGAVARTGGRFEGEVTLFDAADATQAATSTAPAKIGILTSGTLTVEYSDTSPATGTTAKTVSGTLTAETSAPVVSVTEPVNKSATRDRTPAFSGTLSDVGGSGLQLATKPLLFVDPGDAANATVVAVDPAGTNKFEITPSSTTDGSTSVTYTFTPTADLPTSVGANEKPDHQTDWQIRVLDMAGNIGYSDSDPDTANAVSGTPGRGQAHVVRIDQKEPDLKLAVFGYGWDSSVSPAKRKVNVNKSIEVVFDGPIDAASVQTSDFTVEIPKKDGTATVPTAVDVFSGQANSVFLTMPSAIAADATPEVKLAAGASIADTAGNVLTTDSATATDGMAPSLTVALAGGSSASKPTSLTKDTIKITVTADEGLAAITIKVYTAGSTLEHNLSVVPLGNNVYEATTPSATSEAKKSVVVEGTDKATEVSVDLDQDGAAGEDADEKPGANVRKSGKEDVTDAAAITYTVDKTSPTPTLAVTTTDLRQPFVVIAFAEAVPTINKATLDGTDVSASLSASTDKKNWIHKPTTDLALGDHKVIVQATDEAGNKSAETTLTLTITERKAFELPLKPGWNLVSLRGEPADTSINSVITVSAISTVITYDPTATGGPWLVATRGTDGKLAGSLTTIDGVHGYWINTTSFDPIKVLDPKPTGGSLPPAIPVSAGWNLVPARDITGTLTAGTQIATADKYFTGTKIQRAYMFDTLTGVFLQLALTGTTPTGIKVGEAYWAYFTEAGAVVP